MFPTTPSKWFSKFIKKHNNEILNDKTIKKEEKDKFLLPNVNYHGLRHTNATLLISQGVDVTTVSKRLGHSKTSTTTDIYSHSLKRTDKQAADKLDQLFTDKNNKVENQGS
jgi:integrase